MKTITTLFATLTLVGCGNLEGKKIVLEDDDKGSARESKDEPEEETEAREDTDESFAGDEPSAPVAKRNTRKTFDLTPAGCTALSPATLFETETGLTGFLRASCAGLAQVYKVRASLGGTSAGAAERVSNCETVAFSAAQGPDGFLVAYTCQLSPGSFDTYLQDGSGTPTLAHSLRGRTFEGQAPLLAWNAKAATFGLALNGRFLVVGEGYTQMPQEEVTGLAVRDGFWVVLQRGLQTLCTEISPEGAASEPAPLFENESPRDTTLFLGKGILTYAGYTGGWMAAGLTGCEAQATAAFAKDKATTNLLAGAQLNARDALVVHARADSLLLATVQTTGARKVTREIPIAAFAKGDTASLLLAADKAFVSYKSAGKALVSVGSAE